MSLVLALQYLAPLALIFALLLLGRYSGEGALTAAAWRTRPAPRRRRSRVRRRCGAVLLPRGGALLGMALAGRAPPDAAQPVFPLEQRSQVMKKSLATIVAAMLVIPAAASAHITLQPKEAPAGAFMKLDVRVPNEKDNAATTKIDVQFPPGFVFASYEPVPGWTAKVVKEKLTTPIKTDDGEVTEQVRRIVWTGGRVGPGQFQDFPLSVQIPGKAGDKLTFKALQTYGDGDVVRWIGAAESEHPAPVVTVTAPPEETHGKADAEREDDADDSDGASKGLGIAALILGALGLLAGGAALARSRR